MIMRQGGWRGWTAWMLLPALLLIALLPRGYMPDSAALVRGTLTLTLCQMVQPTGTDGAGTPVVDHGLACPFGLLPSAVGPAAQVSIPVPQQWDLAPMIMVSLLVGYVAVWAHGLGARGPPEV